MMLRLPIPAVALLGLQLVPACAKDEPIIGRWTLTEIQGEAPPLTLTLSLDIDEDLGGSLDYSYAMYTYATGIKVDADGAPSYIIDILPSDEISASQMRCALAGDTLNCTDLDDNGLGDPKFKRG